VAEIIEENNIIDENNSLKSFESMISVSRGLKIAMLNINSLSKHFDELQVFMQSKTLDIIAINETKIHLELTTNKSTFPATHVYVRTVIAVVEGYVCT